MNSLPLRCLKKRHLGGSGRYLNFRTSDVKTAYKTALKSLAGQFGTVLLCPQILSGNGNSLLVGAEVDVVARYLRRQRNDHVAA